MKRLCLFLILTAAPLWLSGQSAGEAFTNTPDLMVEHASVHYQPELDQLVFQMQVPGTAGKTVPTALGKVDGAPILGYVFPTTLKSTDIGFSYTEGSVALALTSHPDFDDTPLWDENINGNYGDDGLVWHAHWVVLRQDSRVPGGLSAKKLNLEDPNVKVPPTHPGMPIYLDSPGHPVVTKGHKITVIVPAYRINNQVSFKFDAVTAFMQVNTSDPELPMLGVYQVYRVLSKDLSLPFEVDSP